MRAPDFWWQARPTLAAHFLAGLGAAYAAVTTARMRRPGTLVAVPVLCVGNLVAGGAGKTPTAIALARLLEADGRKPAFLSRGYGRRGPRSAVLVVNPEGHDAREVGDEPLLLARAALTVVSGDRLRAARAAIAAGADCLILDDGLQNPTLAKTWSLAVADGRTGIGNSLCVPAGPLRAPVVRQWPSVSMLCVIGEGEAGERLARQARDFGVAVSGACLVPDAATLERWRGRPLFAFAGIGQPEKFFRTLTGAGLNVTGARAFPDHHAFKASDLASLVQAAYGALLVTTSKDRVRLPADFPAEPLPVTLAFNDPAVIRASINSCA